MLKLKVLTALLPIALFCSCASHSKKPDYTEQYLTAVNNTKGRIIDKETVLNTFGQVFADMKHDHLQYAIEKSYAEQFYFNDTLKTFTERQALITYLLKTADNIDSIEVSIQDIALNNDDYYVRWIMEMRFKALGKTIDSHSIGITHLKFDQEGKIILHQDYWDSTHGLYQHLPLLGFIIRSSQSNF